MRFLFSGPNFDRDIQETVPHLAVSIKEVLETKVVPASATPPQFNNLEDFSSFGGLVRDGFDAVEYRDAQGRFVDSHNESRVQSTTTGGD